MYPGIFLPDRYLPLPKASSLLHLYIYNVQSRRYYPGATDPAYVLYYIDGNHIYRGKGEHSPDNADSQNVLRPHHNRLRLPVPVSSNTLS